MAGSADHHELGVRKLSLEAVGARHRRELVLVAPEDEGGHAKVAQPAARELPKVPGAVELELDWQRRRSSTR